MFSEEDWTEILDIAKKLVADPNQVDIAFCDKVAEHLELGTDYRVSKKSSHYRVFYTLNLKHIRIKK